MSCGPGARVLPGSPAEFGGGPEVIKVNGCCGKGGVPSPIG
jgi:hypothetical protein